MTNAQKVQELSEQFEREIYNKLGEGTLIEFDHEVRVELYREIPDDIDETWVIDECKAKGIKNGYLVYGIDNRGEEFVEHTEFLNNIGDLAHMLDLIEAGKFKMLEIAQ